MAPWKSIARKAGRILGIILGVAVLLLLALWIAIQRPAVQQFVADKVTNSLSRRLQTPFSIRNIELKFFRRVLLEGVYIEDLQGDTLLYAGRLEARLSLFSPFRQQLEVREARLEGAVANLRRSADGIYNFQFIIDAFSSPEPDTSQPPSQWKFGLKKIAVAETRFSLVDSAGQSSLYVKVGDLAVGLREPALSQQKLDIGEISLRNSFCNYAAWAGQAPPPAAPDTASRLAFPFPGLALSAEQFRAEGLSFAYDDFSRPPGPAGQFDPSHIHIDGLQLDIRSFSWADTALAARVRNLALRELNGFELRQLAAGLHMSPADITLTGLEMETPGSRLAAPRAGLRFADFASLSDFVSEVSLEAEVSPSYLAMEDIRYWAGPIPYLKEGYAGKARISGNLQGRVNDLSASRLYAALDGALHLQLNGSLRGLPQTEGLAFGLNLRQLYASYRGIKQATVGLPLPDGLANLGAVQVNGYIGGRLDSFSTRGLRIRTDGYTAFTGDATALGLPDVDKARFQVDIAELRAYPPELKGFLEGELPPALAALGEMQYRGRFSGTIRDFRIAGLLQSEQGQVEENISLSFNQDFSNASYAGQAALSGIQLGAILGDTSTFGAATLSLQAEGSGLSLDSLSARLAATVQSVVFRNYEYHDIQASGMLKRRQFDGTFAIDDPHLCFRFDGLADLNDSIPGFDFTLQLDTAELAYLNLYPSALRLSTRLEAHLRGNSLDNLAGSAALRRLAIANEQHTYFSDSITLNAYERPSEGRVVRFQSDIARAQLAGDYRLAELSGLLLEFVDGFFPVKRLVQYDGGADSLLVPPHFKSQEFRFSASLSRPTGLARIFLPGLQALDTASFEGYFNSEKRRLEIAGQVPRLQYSGMQFDSLQLSVKGAPEGLSNRVSFRGLYSDGQPILAFSEASARLFQDSLLFAVNLLDDTSGQKLALQGMVAAAGERYHMQLSGPLVLNGFDWAIPESNDIAFSPGYLNVKNLKFARNRQEFRIQSRETASGEGFAPVDITFSQFRLVELSRLAGLDEEFLSGALNGKITLSRPDTVFNYEANLDIRQLMVDSQQVGELAIYAAPTPDRRQLNLNVQLAGQENALALAGRYGLADGQLGFHLKAERLQMALADIFAGGAISNSRGVLSGELDIAGTAGEPKVAGSIRFDSASTFVEYLQSRYLVPAHTIRLQENLVDIGRMGLLDPENRRAVLEGQVTHRHFRDIRLGLHFSAPAFQVLDTGPEDNDLFYGKIMVSIDARVEGPLETPAIDVYTQTLPGTRLTALPLTEEEAIAQEGFILYGKPSGYEGDTSRADVYQTSVSGYELNLQLTLTPDAELIAIIDPATGDQLTARGRANLAVEMNRNGQLSTTGDIYLTEGTYFFNYEGLVKRTFQIREGSHMFLPGDPLEARFDITAQYSARTSTYELISQQAGLSAEEASAARRRTEVLVIMALKGTLSEPEITFDIQLPEAQASAVAAAVEARLAQLRERGSELNKQVFGLLLFNSFLAEQSGSATLAEAGENIALSSVSNLVTNQLNRLANQYVKGVDLELRLDSYRTTGQEGAASTVTDVGLGLSKQLFDDRLSIKVGGAVGLGEGAGAEEFTALSSEFLLEYKLTEDGRYRVRVFRRPDYDIIQTSNTVRTGVSILYKKSFGGVRNQRDSTENRQD